MKIETETKLDFSDVLIRPKRTTISSRAEVDLEREFVFPNSGAKWRGIPIMSSNMDTIGTFEVYNVLRAHKMLTTFHKFYTVDDYLEAHEKYVLDPEYFIVSTGIRDNDVKRLDAIIERIDVKFICIDVASGYMKTFVEFCKSMREKYPDKILIAGNVVSREMTEELIINGGIDIVKVGIGSGSACTTRLKTGVGIPQLSAIIECADAGHGTNGCVISDGGIVCAGDMAKAFGAGADFVMLGGVLSGHDENAGDLIVDEDGKKYKEFYGMSSREAMEKHYGEKASYRASEGKYVKIPYKGAIADTIEDYLGGLRSCCAYVNAKKIKNLPKCTTFVKVNRQLNTVYN